ncbi:response regulator [Halobacillus sp. Marseille-Q1614]|uniref:response regulator transcription factor n=1 Tax=Halobacillus sp. Marseille-Q1614 TaxID=2709134 RepID=UPI00156DDA00|nr:response regulator [Halobacillus sp. Marseille-Q1614]
MYKVLLVDDEINILEGIAAIVDWRGCGTELAAKAHHGQMAYEMIEKNPPDIVITDIKMPGLNGVELIQKVYRTYPKVKFIVLSGHDEFEFAKTAMECNVQHYLLKPSNEKKIEEALSKVVQDLDEKNSKELFLEKMRHNLQNVMPKAKEQFLKEFITTKKYGVKDWEYYSSVFEIDSSAEEYRLILLKVDGESEYEQVLALKELVVEQMSDTYIPLETTIGDKIVILIENTSLSDLVSNLQEIKETFFNYYEHEFSAAISDIGNTQQLRQLYKGALHCLTQQFYVAGGSIITVQDVKKQSSPTEELQYDHEDLIFAMRSGDTKTVLNYLNDFFEEIKQEKYEASIVQTHCLELFLSMIRQASKEGMDGYFKQILIFQQYDKFHEIKEFMENTAAEITKYHYERTKQTQSHIIDRVIQYVEENLGDQELSLSSIAAEVLYMNSDYLGKLFKKEKGERFSNFLINRRIEKAIEMIEQSDQVKIFEVAEAVGFGNNPRYFGQVFKKYTGVTPTNYMSKKLES